MTASADPVAATAAELRVEPRGPVLWLTLSRPAQLNALTEAMIAALAAALATAADDDAVRVVVLTGAGRAFCAGADIAAADPHSEQHRQRLLAFMEQVGEVTLAIERLPKPVIAALNGLTLAGGLELALACDLVFAAEGARIGDGHARYGLLPGGGSTARLPRKLPPAKARYLLFTGELLPASDPLLADLLTRVVPDEQLVASVAACAETLAARSPLVLRQLKTLAAAAPGRPIESALAAEREANAAHFHSQDRREGLAAFKEKRPPTFVGR